MSESKLAASPNKMFIACGILVMLSTSYLDNVRGVLLPVIAASLKINYSEASWMLGLGNWSAIVFTLALLPLLKKISLPQLVIVFSFVAMLIAAAAWNLNSYAHLLVIAAVLGGTLAVLGTSANLLVVAGSTSAALPKTLSFLHVMYGLGCMTAPSIAKWWLGRGGNWTILLAAPAPLLLIASALAFRARAAESQPQPSPAPLENDGKPPENPDNKKDRRLLIWMIVTFCAYVTGEVLTSMWMTMYLKEQLSMDVTQSAPYLTGFFVCMAATRLGTAFIASEILVKPLIYAALIGPLLMFGLGYAGVPSGFAMTGIMGPFYPLFMSRITRIFHHSAQRVTIISVVAMQLSLGIAHLTLGKLVDVIGPHLAYLLPPLLITVALCSAFVCFRKNQ